MRRFSFLFLIPNLFYLGCGLVVDNIVKKLRKTIKSYSQYPQTLKNKVFLLTKQQILLTYSKQLLHKIFARITSDNLILYTQSTVPITTTILISIKKGI